MRKVCLRPSGRRSTRIRLGAGDLAEIQSRALAAGRPLESVADLRGVHVEFGDGAAQRVSMHTELASRLALIATMMRKDLKDEAFLEFAYSLGVSDAAGVHMGDEIIQLSLQKGPLFCR